MRASRRPPLEALAPYLLDVPHPRTARRDLTDVPGEPLDWRRVFGNDQAVEIEVGFGKGLFLLTQGLARPDTNFLGVEIERKYALFTAARLAKRGLANVRLACTDARWLLQACVASASVTAVHVYFPDPWWKQRHRKRRLFTPEFVSHAAQVLRPGGRLHFVSDVKEYFDESLQLLAREVRLQPLPLPQGVGTDLTNFERKYRIEGRPIHRAAYERV